MMNISKNMLAIVQVAICYTIIATAQALWKYGILQLGEEVSISFRLICKYLGSWYFLLGASLYVVATALWIYILSQHEFHLVYPMNSIGYIFAIFLSLWLFNESISWNRYLGIGIIVIGVIILALK
jgi:uncharacterized membrane protein